MGERVQIVPDYNPLEEMLTAQIQLDGNEQESELDQYINQNRRNNNRTGQICWQKYRFNWTYAN